MTKIIYKFGEQQLVMVNYEGGLNESETGKYFEWIITSDIPQFLMGDIRSRDVFAPIARERKDLMD